LELPPATLALSQIVGIRKLTLKLRRLLVKCLDSSIKLVGIIGLLALWHITVAQLLPYHHDIPERLCLEVVPQQPYRFAVERILFVAAMCICYRLLRDF